MSIGEQFISGLVGNVADFFETFITAFFNTFIVPAWVVMAGWFGLGG